MKKTINEEILKNFAGVIYEALENASDVLEHFDNDNMVQELLREIHQIRTAIEKENNKNSTKVLNISADKFIIK